MRVRVSDDEIIEVKRTHIYNKVKDVSYAFAKLAEERVSDDAVEMSALCLKSVEADAEVMEVVVLGAKKDLLEFISSLLEVGYCDTRALPHFVLTKKDYKRIFGGTK